jgi:NCS1 family nucleobase:cation symporter-1
MVSKAGKTILPTMVGLGLAWAVVASVSLFGALMTGEPDPTIWAPQIAGDFTAVVVLIFIALANLGSTLVGVFVSTLAIKQTRGLGRKVSWNVVVVCVATPMLICLVFFPHLIFDNVPVFMAYLGMLLGPMIGIQIADWYILGRRRTLSIAGLYKPGRESPYWYVGGFNAAGIIALALGTLTYAAILNPNTYEPNAPFFAYTTAALPSVLMGGLVYVIGTKVMQRFLPARPGRHPEQEGVD